MATIPPPPDLPPPRQPEQVPVIALPSGPTRDPKELVAEAVRGIKTERLVIEESRGQVSGPSTGRVAALVLAVGIVATLIGWGLGRSGGEAPPPQAALSIEDELRTSTWLAAQRLDRFVARQGRLPRDVRELGFTGEWLQYQLRDSVWTLIAWDSTAGATVFLRSVDDRRRFLGGADARVRTP